MSLVVFHILTQLFGEWLTNLFGGDVLAGGAIVAFGLWCIESMLTEYRKTRIVSAAVLGVIGMLLTVGLLTLIDFTIDQRIHMIVAGITVFLLYRAMFRAEKRKLI